MKTFLLSLLSLSAAHPDSKPVRCLQGWNEIPFDPTPSQFTLKTDANGNQQCLSPTGENAIFTFSCITNDLKTEIVDMGVGKQAQVWPRRGCQLRIHVNVPEERAAMTEAKLHATWRSPRKLGMEEEWAKYDKYVEVGYAISQGPHPPGQTRPHDTNADDKREGLTWNYTPKDSAAMTNELEFDLEHWFGWKGTGEGDIMPIVGSEEGAQLAYALEDIFLCVKPKEDEQN